MKTSASAKTFNEYWDGTAVNREGYPFELVELLMRHERIAWNSAIQSAGNNVHFAILENQPSLETVAHDTIWAMKDYTD